MDWKGANDKMKLILPIPVQKAIDQLQKAGYAAYAVGGCVRDHVLGKTPHDYDICTAAVPEKMQEIFKNERTVETGIKHGTLTVIMDHMPLEITTFRQDGEYLDGRHPETVQFTPRVEDDLSRRDFTINAMAYAPDAGIIDPFGGQQDCKAKIIRCVGEAERRFREDALRILRALRFSARLDFEIEEKTARAIHDLKHTLQKVSRERIAAEWTGLLQGPYAMQILLEYADVLLETMPEFSDLAENADQWQEALACLKYLPGDDMLHWAALLQHLAKMPEASAEAALQALKGLKMSAKMQEGVSVLAQWSRAEIAPGNMQEMLMHLGKEYLEKLLLLQRANALAAGMDEAEIQNAYRENSEKLAALLAENACYSLAQLQVNGRDLAALGFRGAEIGERLHALLLSVVRGEIANEKDALLKMAEEGKRK